jgi:hypothetical protein
MLPQPKRLLIDDSFRSALAARGRAVYPKKVKQAQDRDSRNFNSRRVQTADSTDYLNPVKCTFPNRLAASSSRNVLTGIPTVQTDQALITNGKN